MNSIPAILESAFLGVYRSVAAIYRPGSRILGAAILAVFVAMVVAVTHFFPESNWDMIAYSATVVERSESDPAAIHERTYDYVRQNVSEGEFLILTQDRGYRIRQYEDPVAFSTMMGFYRLKLGYVETLVALSSFMDPVKALRLVSQLSAIGIGGLLLTWLARSDALQYGPIVVAGLVLADFSGSAALLSPDLYASLFLIAAALFYIERRDLLTAIALLIALSIRPDHLAFIGVFFVFAFAYGPGRWMMSATFLLAAIAYEFVLKDESHPGWWIHLWFTHVEYVPTLEGFDPPFSLFMYLKMLVRSTVRSLMSQTWLALLFAQVVFFVRVIRPGAMLERPRVLLYAVFTSICAKYLVFPHFETRFYFPYLMIMGMILLVSWLEQERYKSVRRA